MVDGVELVPLDQPRQVGELERDHALRRQQALHAGGEVVEVGNVGEDVVRDQQVRLAALGHEAGRELPAEELDHGLDSPLTGGFGDVRCGLDPERRYAPLDDVLEQIAVVAGKLHHLAVRAEPEALDHRLHVVARVSDPGIRVGREVCVLREDLLRRHELLELYEQALLADPNVERVEGLHRPKPLRGNVALAERRHAEVDEGVAQGRRAEAAAGHRRRGRSGIDLISKFDVHERLSGHQRGTSHDSRARQVEAPEHRFQLRRIWDSARPVVRTTAVRPSGRRWPNSN